MRQFANILTGVDLSRGDRFVNDSLSPPNAEAVRRAIWLAKLNSAKLTFFASLEMSPQAQHRIETEGDLEKSLLSQAEAALDGLVQQAAESGVTATKKVVFGKAWLQLIRQVLRDHHDVVLVGTHHSNDYRGLLFGSTGLKLLRKCP